MVSTRLLVVEDNPLLLEAFIDLLSQKGYLVTGRARNLTDALQQMDAVAFDCVVLDVQLFGVEVAAIVERLHAVRMPYVLLSGNVAADIETPWLRALPQLIMPFGAHELIAAVEQSVTQFAL